jgi:hypothetical protein
MKIPSPAARAIRPIAIPFHELAEILMSRNLSKIAKLTREAAVTHPK